MGVFHRTMFTWFTFLVFLVLLVLRIDSRTQWNWFVVFIPVWVFNAILLIYSIFQTTSECKNQVEHARVELLKNVQVIIGVFLMMAFEVMLCMKLEFQHLDIPLPYVMAPLWIILPVVIIRIPVFIYRSGWNYV